MLEFPLESENCSRNAQKIYDSYGTWLRFFEDYVKLITKQGTRNRVSIGDGPELLFSEDSKLKYISNNSPTAITIEMSSVDESLHLEQYRETTQLASRFLQPRLHYRILLESYSARKSEDYRKAIIEAATALEVCLTMRILEEFNTQGISFGEKLLQKFRMIGGRFELVRLLDISLPGKDYVSLVMNPRNDVIHRASFPNKQLANQVIIEVEELLHLLSPQLYEDEMQVI